MLFYSSQRQFESASLIYTYKISYLIEVWNKETSVTTFLRLAFKFINVFNVTQSCLQKPINGHTRLIKDLTDMI